MCDARVKRITVTTGQFGKSYVFQNRPKTIHSSPESETILYKWAVYFSGCWSVANASGSFHRPLVWEIAAQSGHAGNSKQAENGPRRACSPDDSFLPLSAMREKIQFQIKTTAPPPHPTPPKKKHYSLSPPQLSPLSFPHSL